MSLGDFVDRLDQGFKESIDRIQELTKERDDALRLAAEGLKPGQYALCCSGCGCLRLAPETITWSGDGVFGECCR